MDCVHKEYDGTRSSCWSGGGAKGTARLVVNCTGLGAQPLFSDAELIPIKGQLTYLLPQPEVNYVVLADDLYMFPRRDGIVLGGTHVRGDWSLEPDLAAKTRIFSRHEPASGGIGSTRQSFVQSPSAIDPVGCRAQCYALLAEAEYAGCADLVGSLQHHNPGRLSRDQDGGADALVRPESAAIIRSRLEVVPYSPI